MLAEAPPVRGSEAWHESQKRTCANHARFPTEDAAWRHYIEQLRANGVDPGQTVYFCTACGWFHHGGGIRSLGRLIAESGGEHGG